MLHEFGLGISGFLRKKTAKIRKKSLSRMYQCSLTGTREKNGVSVAFREAWCRVYRLQTLRFGKHLPMRPGMNFGEDLTETLPRNRFPARISRSGNGASGTKVSARFSRTQPIFQGENHEKETRVCAAVGQHRGRIARLHLIGVLDLVVPERFRLALVPDGDEAGVHRLRRQFLQSVQSL